MRRFLSSALLALVLAALGFVVVPAPAQAADQDDKEELKQAGRNLQQLLLAMQNYHDAMGRFPGAGYGAGPDNVPLQELILRNLSWRVSLLPYLEELNIYQGIVNGDYGKVDPAKVADYWNNAKLLKQRPKLYAGGKNLKDETLTPWRVFVGNGAAFDKDQVATIRQFTDGTSNTILIVEAADAVPWTKADEILYDPKKPLPRFGGRFKEGFLVGMADGSVRIIPYNTDEKVIRAMITRAGGELIDPLPGRVLPLK